MPETQNQLKELSSALTFAADFKDYFKQILDFIAKLKKQNIAEMENMKQAVMGMAETMKEKMQVGNEEDMQNKQQEMMDYCQTEMAKIMEEHKAKMTALDKKMAEIHDGIDADENRVAENASQMAISEVLKQIPTIGQIEEDIPKLGLKIRDSLELLSGDNRLDISAIADLQTILDELKNRPLGGKGGGGFSLMAMQQHFIDDETPSGTVNGVNKDFTISLTPNTEASLKVFVNGQRMKLTTDYTFSGKTITFLTAPPTDSIISVDYRT